jgi:hypothetical protein
MTPEDRRQYDKDYRLMHVEQARQANRSWYGRNALQFNARRREKYQERRDATLAGMARPTVCPFCGHSVRRDYLSKHVRRLHSEHDLVELDKVPLASWGVDDDQQEAVGLGPSLLEQGIL